MILLQEENICLVNSLPNHFNLDIFAGEVGAMHIETIIVLHKTIPIVILLFKNKYIPFKFPS